MLKAKEYKIEDSNIANLGSDLDKKVRVAAAQTEKAWTEAGKTPGLQIWRIEKFNVQSIPADSYGTFYSGDSYIILNTYKKKDSPKLHCDVHFWLGKYTTQDEAGTAAYKTVELDDLLGGEPAQHREVQGYESDLFLSYFKNIRILEGGVDSGFKHVEPEKYVKRLLHLKGKKRVRVVQVDTSYKSLNSGDCFILDAGLKILQFNGKKSSPMEKNKAGELAKALHDERKGLAKISVFEENGSDVQEFFAALGDHGPIRSAEEGGDDTDFEKNSEKKLFQLSDASGTFQFKEIAKGSEVKKNHLQSEDVFILDSGSQIFAWIGKGASVGEKKKAMQFAQDYLTKFNRPLFLPITRILEGGENEVFNSLLH